jgi:hypothetical protein
MDYRCACPPGHYGDQCELKGEKKKNFRFHLKTKFSTEKTSFIYMYLYYKSI